VIKTVTLDLSSMQSGKGKYSDVLGAQLEVEKIWKAIGNIG
jgi:hypothetical protein